MDRSSSAGTPLAIASAVLAGLIVSLLSIVLMISLAGMVFSGPLAGFLRQGIGLCLFGGVVLGHCRSLRNVLSRDDLPPPGRHRRDPGAQRGSDCRTAVRRRPRDPLRYGRGPDRPRLRGDRPRLHRRRRVQARGSGAVHPLPGDGRLPGGGRIPDDCRGDPHGGRASHARGPGAARGRLAMAAGARARSRDGLGRPAVGEGPGAAGDAGAGLRRVLPLAAPVRSGPRGGRPTGAAARAVSVRSGVPRGLSPQFAGASRLPDHPARDPGAGDAGRARVRRGDAERLGDRARHRRAGRSEPRPARGGRRQRACGPGRRPGGLSRPRRDPAGEPDDRRRTRAGSA